jgi:hypothetical protein
MLVNDLKICVVFDNTFQFVNGVFITVCYIIVDLIKVQQHAS